MKTFCLDETGLHISLLDLILVLIANEKKRSNFSTKYAHDEKLNGWSTVFYSFWFEQRFLEL